jgi:HPt (histidine-containing phosphotransfer) domain-containing protein
MPSPPPFRCIRTSRARATSCLTNPDCAPGPGPGGTPILARRNENDCKVTVARDLEDLIPVFLKNRKKELDALRVALAAANFEQLRQLGHRMKGVGNSYGFNHVSTLGKYIEDGARSGDRASLEARIVEYDEYLSKVQISYE